MKKILGIVALAGVCMLLGLSVRWSRERDLTLVLGRQGGEIAVFCYE